MTDLLNVRNVSRHFGEAPNQVVALCGVDLAISPGEFVAIIGPSGSGKSTLLAIAGGLDTPTEGAVEFDGVQLSSASPTELAAIRRRHIGFVFQSYNLLGGLTAAENVAAPLELDGVSHRDAMEEARERLAVVGLGGRGDAFPDDLSGGEQQRVAIARGLVGRRRLLLADEPTGALDQSTGTAILGMMRDACSHDVGVGVVTHDPVVAGWADRIVALRDGRLDPSATR